MIAIVKIRQAQTTVLLICEAESIFSERTSHLSSSSSTPLAGVSWRTATLSQEGTTSDSRLIPPKYLQVRLKLQTSHAITSLLHILLRKIFLFPHKPTVSLRIMCLCCRQILGWRAVIGISLFGTFYRADQVFFVWYGVNLNLVFLFPNPKLLQD